MYPEDYSYQAEDDVLETLRTLSYVTEDLQVELNALRQAWEEIGVEPVEFEMIDQYFNDLKRVRDNFGKVYAVIEPTVPF